MISYFIFTI